MADSPAQWWEVIANDPNALPFAADWFEEQGNPRSDLLRVLAKTRVIRRRDANYYKLEEEVSAICQTIQQQAHACTGNNEIRCYPGLNDLSELQLREISAEDLIDHAGEIFQLFPVPHVFVDGINDQNVQAFTAIPEMHYVRHLSIRHGWEESQEHPGQYVSRLRNGWRVVGDGAPFQPMTCAAAMGSGCSYQQACRALHE